MHDCRFHAHVQSHNHKSEVSLRGLLGHLLHTVTFLVLVTFPDPHFLFMQLLENLFFVEFPGFLFVFLFIYFFVTANGKATIGVFNTNKWSYILQLF